MKRGIQQIDDDLKYFLERLKYHNLSDLNIVILSDHGFVDTDKDLVYLEDYIDSSTYSLTDNTPIMSIWPLNDGKSISYEICSNLSSSRHFSLSHAVCVHNIPYELDYSYIHL